MLLTGSTLKYYGRHSLSFWKAFVNTLCMNVITKLTILQDLFLNRYQVVSTQAVLFLADSPSLLRGLYKDQKFRTISVNAPKDIKLSQKYSLYNYKVKKYLPCTLSSSPPISRQVRPDRP